MSDTHADEPAQGFHALTPDVVMDCVEEACDVRCTGVCRPLNSYINRVYELGIEPEGAVVAKFYRPGRWSRAALEDELAFVDALHAEEVPVIPPRRGHDGALLHDVDGTWFAVYPRMGGRVVDEPTTEQWLALGRLIGRAHVVGARDDAAARVRMTPDALTAPQVEQVADAGVIEDPDLRDRWVDTALDLVDELEPLFDDVDLQRIHGDLHAQNLIHRPDEGFYLIDFDDMAMGPVVQDLWMLLPGRLVDARAEAGLLVEGYETFAPLDRSGLLLIEPLRFMRFIHFTAWCAMQAADGGHRRLAPGWGTDAYWAEELRAMEQQAQEIRDALEDGLPSL